MTFELSPYVFGTRRTPEQVAAMRACEEVFTAFCDFMDQGEVDQAVDLHFDDLVFFDTGKAEPMLGKEPLRNRLKAVRFSYPGRRTLHTPSNFRFHRVTETEAECHVVIALFDLVRNPEGKRINAYSTEFLGYAEEDILFRLDEAAGIWRFHTRRIAFMAGAKRLPIGTLPKDLPWDAET